MYVHLKLNFYKIIFLKINFHFSFLNLSFSEPATKDKCLAGYYECASNGSRQCISQNYTCDGYKNCPSSDDERGCKLRPGRLQVIQGVKQSPPPEIEYIINNKIDRKVSITNGIDNKFDRKVSITNDKKLSITNEVTNDRKQLKSTEKQDLIALFKQLFTVSFRADSELSGLDNNEIRYDLNRSENKECHNLYKLVVGVMAVFGISSLVIITMITLVPTCHNEPKRAEYKVIP